MLSDGVVKVDVIYPSTRSRKPLPEGLSSRAVSAWAKKALLFVGLFVSIVAKLQSSRLRKEFGISQLTLSSSIPCLLQSSCLV